MRKRASFSDSRRRRSLSRNHPNTSSSFDDFKENLILHHDPNLLPDKDKKEWRKTLNIRKDRKFLLSDLQGMYACLHGTLLDPITQFQRNDDDPIGTLYPREVVDPNRKRGMPNWKTGDSQVFVNASLAGVKRHLSRPKKKGGHEWNGKDTVYIAVFLPGNDAIHQYTSLNGTILAEHELFGVSEGSSAYPDFWMKMENEELTYYPMDDNVSCSYLFFRVHKEFVFSNLPSKLLCDLGQLFWQQR